MATNKYGDTIKVMEVQILNYDSDFPTLRVTSKNIRTDMTEYYDSNAITTVDLNSISGMLPAQVSGVITDLRSIVTEHVTKTYN